jgi:hypothetical protein
MTNTARLRKRSIAFITNGLVGKKWAVPQQ